MLSINFGKLTKDHCKNFCDGYVNSSGKQIKGMVDWVFERKVDFLDYKIISLRKNFPIRSELKEFKKKLTKEEIRNILSCNYSDLRDINNEYLKFNFNFWITPKTETNLLEKIFDYSLFRDYKKTIVNGFWLSKKLEIECCPYCNRNYTTSHQTFFKNIKGKSKEKFVFPEFDHFFPKDKHPVLAVSFYNLIPSCNICNTYFKQDRESHEIFNPYKTVKSKYFSFINFPNDVSTLYGANDNIILDFEYNCDDKTEQELKNS